MSLQSRLLSGDQKLEACLLNDASHVTPGALGEHVSKIQAALSIVDEARIHADELSARYYGSSTAGAVLAFKRTRHIINFSYQTQADDIVGKMTIAALDEEVRKKTRPPGVMPGYPPRLFGSVGYTGANLPHDIGKVGELLWAAGYRPFGSRGPKQLRLIGDMLPAPSLPLEDVVKGVGDFLHDQGLPLGYNLTPNSAPLYQLYGQAVALMGNSGGSMFLPAPGTLREAICNAALANSSGTCKQAYLNQTHNGDLTVPVKIHWCGIFAAWVWRQAIALVYFKRGDKTPKGAFGGIWRESPDQFLGGSGRLNCLFPGDIIVFSPTGGRNHHAIVTSVSVSSTKNVPNIVNLVEGNAGGNPPESSIVKRTDGAQLAANSEAKQFYSVDTFQNSTIRY